MPKERAWPEIDLGLAELIPTLSVSLRQRLRHHHEVSGASVPQISANPRFHSLFTTAQQNLAIIVVFLAEKTFGTNFIRASVNLQIASCIIERKIIFSSKAAFDVLAARNF